MGEYVSLAHVIRRALILARARLEGEFLGERLPIAPLLFVSSLSALFGLLTRNALGPYPYGVFALTVALALTALPLLGELGPLLRADPANEWVGAQPVRPSELRLARIMVLGLALVAITCAVLLPMCLLAPGDVGWLARVGLVVGGLAQTAFLAALILWVQAACAERAEGLLVAFQAVLLTGVLVGLLSMLGHLAGIAAFEGPSGALLSYPPAWFALPFASGEYGPAPWYAAAALLFAGLTFLAAPFPPAARNASTRSALGFLLHPLRRLATRIWVRPEERAAFDLAYDGLPAEREFVIRTYPLVAVPLAFLMLGADPNTRDGQGLFAILLFAPATYLPALLLFVPGTATPDARHLLDVSPLRPVDEMQGALKAVALRFLAPLLVCLFALVALRADLDLALRLGPPAALAALWTLRVLWKRYVTLPLLSTAHNDLGSAWNNDLTGGMFTVGLAMTLLALFTWVKVLTPAMGLGIGVLGLLLELSWGRRARA
ncbi:MAG: hypothetical protein ACI8QC_001176 [Planctomycetota bacterium]|jgi:hypothetical protein